MDSLYEMIIQNRISDAFLKQFLDYSISPESTIPKSCQEMVHMFTQKAIANRDTTFRLFIVFTALMYCEPIRARYLPDDVSEPLFTWMTETLQEAWENLFMGCDPKTRIPSLIDFVSHLQTEASMFMHAPSTRSDC
jgi:hypothetical protein